MGVHATDPRPVSRPVSHALRCEDLRRSFAIRLGLGRREVLRGIELEVERGTTLALVGPNGSGKSTLLRILAGVDRASGGDLQVLGGDPRTSAVRARLAYLPEDSPFPGDLTALDALELLGALGGMGRRAVHARGMPLLERVGLGAHAKAFLRTYSRGMLRRFGLAQAFLTDPELVLLDEPTAGLDAPGFAVVDGLLADARDRGTTLVLASHVLEDVRSRCDRVAVLLDGRVVAAGSPASLLGVTGRTAIEVEGLEEEGLASLETWVQERGGRVTDRTPAQGSLLELYRRYSGDDDRDGR